MSQEPNQPPRNPNGGNGNQPPEGGGGFNWRGMMLLLIASMLIGLAFFSQIGGGFGGNKIGSAKFKALAKEGLIVADIEQYPLVLRKTDGSAKSYITGTFVPDGVKKNAKPEEYESFTAMVHLTTEAEKNLYELLKESKSYGVTESDESNLYDYLVDEVDNSYGPAIIFTFMPIVLILLILYFLFRHQMKMSGRGAMSFGKSKAKMMSLDKNKITFKNVAGVEEAKEEVFEIVEFLKDPKKFQRLGGRIPKGVLMVGSPGTGKTLLARAIAGEADVPFFTISGSDFVEMFVGVGASRVRDMFEQGKKNAPCIIFIDEIDAVGRHRGHGMGGGHDEREQTLNALLVEMDGFDTQEGVIIIAATNRPDVLDPALLRPGRFDRQITVNLPDVKGREAILKVHAKKIKLGKEVDLGLIARGTPGFSGAELANLINEAALLAASQSMKSVQTAQLEEARDKVRWGRERRSLAISEKEKGTTAYHEAGHAILVEKLENTEPLHKVTIIPRGPSLGSTMWLPAEDKYNMRRNEMLDNLIVAMGGRVAEEIVFGDVTSGASGDIKMATGQARKMVCEWGMSDALGMVEYGNNQEHVFLARDFSQDRNYSEDTAQKIDQEVKRFIDEAYATAKKMLLEHRTELDTIAQALLEFETLDGSQIREIMEFGEMQNPPSAPLPPALPVDMDPSSSHSDPVSDEEDDEFPGGLEGAPVGA
ncbi:MAG: cell division protease FtsH [Verrucomicrobiales bacterium]|jgi:cell division protease FtsH